MTAPAPEAGANPAPADPAPSPANMPQQAPAQAAAEPTGEGETPEEGQQSDYAKELAKLRKENASWRTKLREQEQSAQAAAKALEDLQAKYTQSDDRWNQLAKIFNPEADKPPTVEELTAQWDLKTAEYESKLSEREAALAERDAQVRSLSVRAALPTALAKHNADPSLTEAVLTASGVLAKLDPTSESFSTDLESAVAAAVEANPRLKVTPVATRSGAEIPGRTGGSDQLTYEQVKRMSPAEIEKARSEGRLRNLLSGGR